jgi:hypothetical protein
MTENYYAILGVAETASVDEIKARFRFLSQAYHPDKFPARAHKQSAEEEFKRINQAYQVLSDSAQRARYDAARSTAASYPPKPKSQRPAPSPPPEPGSQHRNEPSPSPSAAPERVKAFPARRLVSAQSLFLGVGLSVVIALVLKAVYAYIAAFWLLEMNAAARLDFFMQHFDFGQAGPLLTFVRTVLTLTLFFYLSFTQKTVWVVRYLICASLFLWIGIALDAIYFKLYLAEVIKRPLFVQLFSRATEYLLALCLFIAGLGIMDFVVRQTGRWSTKSS